LVRTDYLFAEARGDAIYSHVKDAVSIGLAGNPLGAGGNPLPPFLPQILTATISDNTSVMHLSRRHSEVRTPAGAPGGG
jgi:hypothetical protein